MFSAVRKSDQDQRHCHGEGRGHVSQFWGLDVAVRFDAGQMACM